MFAKLTANVPFLGKIIRTRVPSTRYFKPGTDRFMRAAYEAKIIPFECKKPAKAIFMSRDIREGRKRYLHFKHDVVEDHRWLNDCELGKVYCKTITRSRKSGIKNGRAYSVPGCKFNVYACRLMDPNGMECTIVLDNKYFEAACVRGYNFSYCWKRGSIFGWICYGLAKLFRVKLGLD